MAMDNIDLPQFVFEVSAKMGPHLPAKCAKTARGVLQDEPAPDPADLLLSTTFQRIYRKRIQLCRRDPGIPTPEVRMTVVNKLPQTM